MNEMEQTQEDKYRQIRDAPLTNKNQLDNYLKHFYGVHLAGVPIEEGNSTPLDFVWSIYNVAMNGNEKDL